MVKQGRRGPYAREAIGLEVPPPSGTPTLLVLEDEPEIQSLVCAMLKIRGHSCEVAGTLAEAKERMEAERVDILFADVHLPDGSGLSLIEGGGGEAPLVVVMTGSNDIETAIRAIRGGAIDFIPKPFSVGQFLQRLDKAVEQWKERQSLEHYGRALETLVELKSEELSRSSRHIDEVCDMTVAALGAALNLKDHETADHCARVSQNSVSLGATLSLSGFELRNLKWGAYLHDVGKIGIPERILRKQGELEPEERRVVEKHPIMGYTMIRNIEFLVYATDVVQSHHERFDGTGYPHGLSGERIPLNARILPSTQ